MNLFLFANNLRETISSMMIHPGFGVLFSCVIGLFEIIICVAVMMLVLKVFYK